MVACEQWEKSSRLVRLLNVARARDQVRNAGPVASLLRIVVKINQPWHILTEDKRCPPMPQPKRVLLRNQRKHFFDQRAPVIRRGSHNLAELGSCFGAYHPIRI